MAIQSRDEIKQALEALRQVTDGVQRPAAMSQVFGAMSGDVVRPQHAASALTGADEVAVYEYLDIRKVIATRVTAGMDDTFVLVVLVDERPGPRAIRAAYRVYCDPQEAKQLTDPSLAFATFLERFALPYMSEGRLTRFVPVLVLPPPVGNVDPLNAMGVQAVPNVEAIVNASFRLDDDALRIAWPFVINLTAYRRTIRRR